MQLNSNWKVYFFLALLLGLALRLGGMFHSLWNDEIISFTLANQSDPWQVILATISGDSHPPLFYLLLHFWIKWSHSEFWLRCLTLIPAMGTLVFLGLISFELNKDRKAALLAVILGAVTYALVWPSFELRNYSWQVCTSLACLFWGLKTTSQSSFKNWLVLGLLTAISWFFFYYALYAATAIYVSLWLYERTKKQFYGLLVAGMSSLAVFGVWVVPLWQQTQRYALDREAGSMSLAQTLTNLIEHFAVNGIFSGINLLLISNGLSPRVLVVVGGLVLVVIVSLPFYSKRLEINGLVRKRVILLVNIMLVFMILVLIGGAGNVWVSDRYTTFLACMMILLFSQVTPLIKSKWQLPVVVLLVGLQLNESSILLSSLKRQDWRAVAEFLEQRLKSDDKIALIASFTKNNLGFYLKTANEMKGIPDEIVPSDVVVKNFTLEPQHLAHVNRFMTNSSGVYVVWSHFVLPKVDRGYQLMQRNFTENSWYKTEEKHFHQIIVQKFERGPQQ